MQNVLLKAFSFVIIIALGYILKHFGLFKEHEKSVLTRLLMNVTMPCALLVSFAGSAGSGLPVYAGIGALCAEPHGNHQFVVFFILQRTERVGIGILQSSENAVDPGCHLHGNPSDSTGVALIIAYENPLGNL